jgi:ATP phosphoribosyltransferase-like protein
VQSCVLFQYKIRKVKLRESIKVTLYLREQTIKDDAEKGWVAVSSVVEEKGAARVMHDLLSAGACDLRVPNIANTMIVGDRH